MKLPILPLSLSLVFVCLVPAIAQKRTIATNAVVLDERLSVLRVKPGLYADQLFRLRRRRVVQIVGAIEADGVKFYRIVASQRRSGWVQSDAIFVSSRTSDEQRLLRLIQSRDGFDRLELASEFLKHYPVSKLRPAMLLLFGDLLEDAAAKLSRDARTRLKEAEIISVGAPIHSYYLNFNMLDRYRRLGVRFLFNSTTREFHYDGASWREIVRKYPRSGEAIEGRTRLDLLERKLSVSN